MSRKKEALKYQINNDLRGKIAFGESKHKEKQELGFGESTYKIYSYGTYNTYLKETQKYAEWLIEVKGIDKYTKLANTEQYAKEYLQYRLNVDKVSVYTLKMEKSALGMLYNKMIEIDLPTRTPDKITRSRNNSNYHYNPNGAYKNVFTLALGTGGRRADLLKLTKQNFKEIDGKLYVEFTQSKGGRNRITYVREEYADAIKNMLNNSKNGEKIISKIPKSLDVHALRREYCKGLYNEIKDNKELRNTILKNYPVRREFKTQKDKEGNVYTKEIQSNVYKDRQGNIYDRDDIYVLSQCLGHNRLDVTITHYLKS